MFKKYTQVEPSSTMQGEKSLFENNLDESRDPVLASLLKPEVSYSKGLFYITYLLEENLLAF